MTIKQQISIYLQSKGWEFGGKIEDYIRQVDGAKASNASRRCREMANDGKLESRKVKFNGKNVVQYRIKQFNPVMGIPARELDLYLLTK